MRRKSSRENNKNSVSIIILNLKIILSLFTPNVTHKLYQTYSIDYMYTACNQSLQPPLYPCDKLTTVLPTTSTKHGDHSLTYHQY